VGFPDLLRGANRSKNGVWVERNERPPRVSTARLCLREKGGNQKCGRKGKPLFLKFKPRSRKRTEGEGGGGGSSSARFANDGRPNGRGKMIFLGEAERKKEKRKKYFWKRKGKKEKITVYHLFTGGKKAKDSEKKKKEYRMRREKGDQERGEGEKKILC